MFLCVLVARCACECHACERGCFTHIRLAVTPTHVTCCHTQYMTAHQQAVNKVRVLMPVRTLLASCAQALRTLNKGDIAEVKGMKAPPEPVRMVMQAVW
jgi:hypothetical protein